MKKDIVQVVKLEAGDEIYVVNGSEIKPVTLTEKHFYNGDIDALETVYDSNHCLSIDEAILIYEDAPNNLYYLEKDSYGYRKSELCKDNSLVFFTNYDLAEKYSKGKSINNELVALYTLGCFELKVKRYKEKILDSLGGPKDEYIDSLIKNLSMDELNELRNVLTDFDIILSEIDFYVNLEKN